MPHADAVVLPSDGRGAGCCARLRLREDRIVAQRILFRNAAMVKEAQLPIVAVTVVALPSDRSGIRINAVLHGIPCRIVVELHHVGFLRIRMQILKLLCKDIAG